MYVYVCTARCIYDTNYRVYVCTGRTGCTAAHRAGQVSYRETASVCIWRASHCMDIKRLCTARASRTTFTFVHVCTRFPRLSDLPSFYDPPFNFSPSRITRLRFVNRRTVRAYLSTETADANFSFARASFYRNCPYDCLDVHWILRGIGSTARHRLR